jgi:hypothetical protein
MLHFGSWIALCMNIRYLFYFNAPSRLLGNYPRPKYKQLGASLKVAAISLVKSLVSMLLLLSPELNLIPASTYENQSVTTFPLLC